MNLDFLTRIPPEGLGDFLDKSIGDLSLMTWIAFGVVACGVGHTVGDFR